MENTVQRNARIERPTEPVKVIVPTSKGEISYIHPAKGPSKYTEVGK